MILNPRPLGSPWNRGHNQEPSWRLPLYEGNRYLNSRDRRNKYDRSAKEIVDYFTPSYDGVKGISTWAGHGNDPLYYSL